jgi:phage tail-like protein
MKAGVDSDVPATDFRKDILIDLFNERGERVLSYKVFRCWVSEVQALPDLDANANSVVIQHIRLENERWERDATVDKPVD